MTTTEPCEPLCPNGHALQTLWGGATPQTATSCAECFRDYRQQLIQRIIVLSNSPARTENAGHRLQTMRISSLVDMAGFYGIDHHECWPGAKPTVESIEASLPLHDPDKQHAVPALARLNAVVEELRRITDNRELTDELELVRLVEIDLNAEHERALMAERELAREKSHLDQARLLGFQNGWDKGVETWALSTGKLVRMLIDTLKATESCDECVPMKDNCEPHSRIYAEVISVLDRRLAQVGVN